MAVTTVIHNISVIPMLLENTVKVSAKRRKKLHKTHSIF